jgi:hypothetical protein
MEHLGAIHLDAKAVPFVHLLDDITQLGDTHCEQKGIRLTQRTDTSLLVRTMSWISRKRPEGDAALMRIQSGLSSFALDRSRRVSSFGCLAVGQIECRSPLRRVQFRGS